MLDLIKNKYRIINVDETWLNESNLIRKSWAPKRGPSVGNTHTIQPRLSMISALDSEGRIWFALTHATTDSDVIILFLRKLILALDNETPGW